MFSYKSKSNHQVIPPFVVIPAKAGIHPRFLFSQLDSRFRGNDPNSYE